MKRASSYLMYLSFNVPYRLAATGTKQADILLINWRCFKCINLNCDGQYCEPVISVDIVVLTCCFVQKMCRGLSEFFKTEFLIKKPTKQWEHIRCVVETDQTNSAAKCGRKNRSLQTPVASFSCLQPFLATTLFTLYLPRIF